MAWGGDGRVDREVSAWGWFLPYLRALQLIRLTGAVRISQSMPFEGC